MYSQKNNVKDSISEWKEMTGDKNGNLLYLRSIVSTKYETKFGPMQVQSKNNESIEVVYKKTHLRNYKDNSSFKDKKDEIKSPKSVLKSVKSHFEQKRAEKQSEYFLNSVTNPP